MPWVSNEGPLLQLCFSYAPDLLHSSADTRPYDAGCEHVSNSMRHGIMDEASKGAKTRICYAHHCK